MAYFNNVLRNDNAPNNFDYGTLAQIDGFYQQNSDECHPLRQDIDYAQNYQRNHQSSFTKNDASISTYSLLNYMTHNEQELKRPLFAELQPNNIAHTVANHPPISELIAFPINKLIDQLILIFYRLYSVSSIWK